MMLLLLQFPLILSNGFGVVGTAGYINNTSSYDSYIVLGRSTSIDLYGGVPMPANINN